MREQVTPPVASEVELASINTHLARRHVLHRSIASALLPTAHHGADDARDRIHPPNAQACSDIDRVIGSYRERTRTIKPRRQR
jgi:hypothetical protein